MGGCDEIYPIHYIALRADMVCIDDDLRKAGVTDIPRGYPGFQTPQEEQCLHDGSKAVRMLGLNMTSRSKMVCDAVTSLRERFGKKSL